MFGANSVDSHVAETSQRSNLPGRVARLKMGEDVGELVLGDRLHGGSGSGLSDICAQFRSLICLPQSHDLFDEFQKHKTLFW